MFKSGLYYVGDLCYVLHDEWDEVCALTIKGHQLLNGEFTLKDGRKFALYSTKFGDGLYYDQSGNEYGVDAGSIGCILAQDIDLGEPNNYVNGGNFIQFEQDFVTSGDDGLIKIGFVEIDTGDSYEEDIYA